MYALHPAFEAFAIASPNRAAAIAAERNIPHAFASIEEMLAKVGDQLDVISIASPPFDHHRSVMAALAAGKHILCEKPFALDLVQAQEMAAAAERRGVATALAFEFRYMRAPRALRRLVVEGRLGLLREVEVLRLGKELRRGNARPRSSWWYDGQQGGGIANAFMPHLVDLAHFVTGRTPHASHGFIRTANPVRKDPTGGTYPMMASDGAFALEDLGEGLVARVSVDATAAGEFSRVELRGETLTAIATGPALNDLTITVDDGSGPQPLALEPPLYTEPAGTPPNVLLFLGLLDDFARRIAGEKAPGATFADGLASQRVLDAIGYGV
jgi:predicted dehydrogenase